MFKWLLFFIAIVFVGVFLFLYHPKAAAIVENVSQDNITQTPSNQTQPINPTQPSTPIQPINLENKTAPLNEGCSDAYSCQERPNLVGCSYDGRSYCCRFMDINECTPIPNCTNQTMTRDALLYPMGGPAPGWTNTIMSCAAKWSVISTELIVNASDKIEFSASDLTITPVNATSCRLMNNNWYYAANVSITEVLCL